MRGRGGRSSKRSLRCLPSTSSSPAGLRKRRRLSLPPRVYSPSTSPKRLRERQEPSSTKPQSSTASSSRLSIASSSCLTSIEPAKEANGSTDAIEAADSKADLSQPRLFKADAPAQSLRNANTANLAKLNPFDIYEKAATSYRYLANEGSPLFLHRTLSYWRLSRSLQAPQLNGHAKDLKPSPDSSTYSLAIDLKSILDLSALSSPVDVRVDLVKVSLMEERRRGGSGSGVEREEAELHCVGRSRVEVEDGRVLNPPTLRIPDFPATHFFPSLSARAGAGQRLHTALYLLFSFDLRMDAESVSSGGRSLRNVPQRRSLRAELLNGSAGQGDGQPQRLFAFLFLCSPGRPQPPTQRLISLPLIPAPSDIHSVPPALPHDSLARLRLMAKKAAQDEVGSPHIKLQLRQIQDPFAMVALTKTKAQSPKKPNGLHKSPKRRLAKAATVPPELAFPSRLLYTFHMDVNAGDAPVAEEQGPSNRSHVNSFLSEVQSPDKCPFCKRRFPHLLALLAHLRHSHSRLCFLYKPEDGEQGHLASVEVSVNANFDGSWEGVARRPYILRAQERPAKGGVSTTLLVSRSSRLHSSNLSLHQFQVPEKMSNQQVSNGTVCKEGHTREYFDSVSLAVVGAEGAGRVETGSCDWLGVASSRNLSDYSDVNSGERELMMAWNQLAFSNRPRFISHGSMETACSKLVEERGRSLVSRGLLRNTALHLATFFHRGYLSLSAFTRLVRRLNELAV